MKVLHDVPCPVWTYHQHGAGADDYGADAAKSPVSTIVCSLELTEEAVPLLRFTQDLAGVFGAEVHLVHVIPGMNATSYEYFDAAFEADLKDAAEQTIAKLQREAATDFPSVVLSDGSIVQDVAEFAQEKHADLVVIGRGKAQLTFGSVRTHAYEIIRYAHCPLLSYSAGHEHQTAGTTPPGASRGEREVA
ncbi:MAG TPA: universal stress protein, partial [Bryobacteraceae bacterium]|nr:universal stress protein [Bryobacteraceae bacterium]